MSTEREKLVEKARQYVERLVMKNRVRNFLYTQIADTDYELILRLMADFALEVNAEQIAYAVCLYCGQKQPKIEPYDREKVATMLAEHTEHCPTHPVNQWQKAEAELARLRPYVLHKAENAPRTGEHILGIRFDGGIGFGTCGGKKQVWCAVVHWWAIEGEVGWYLSNGNDGNPVEITHWMPLPEGTCGLEAALKGE